MSRYLFPHRSWLLTLLEVTECSSGGGDKTPLCSGMRAWEIPGRQSPASAISPGLLGAGSGGAGPGEGWGWASPRALAVEEHLKQQLWREETPLPCKVLFVYHHHYWKCAHPSKTSGSHIYKRACHTGAGGFWAFSADVGSNSWGREVVQGKDKMTSLYSELTELSRIASLIPCSPPRLRGGVNCV